MKSKLSLEKIDFFYGKISESAKSVYWNLKFFYLFIFIKE